MNQTRRMGTAIVLLGCTVTAVLACTAPTPSDGDTPPPSTSPPTPGQGASPSTNDPPAGQDTTDRANGPVLNQGTSRPPGGPAPGPGGQERLAALAAQVEDFLRRRFPGEFAGVVLDVPGHAVIVYRRPSAKLDAALRDRFPGQPIRPRDAAHSAHELGAVARRVTQDVHYWKARGVTITTIAVTPDGSAVEIGTSDVARAARELPKRYGDAPLRFITSTPTLITPPTAPG
ncbi:hypothetical protein ABZT47_13645 [Sphaerisporangium sp. NPDC005289]|uniref:hypothetical protein n=1 Tax=Sphaerisporangium sp. NPDC005289 TaxID=3155247 RepID=UPI0033BEF108